MRLFKQLSADFMKKLKQYSQYVVNAVIEVWFACVIFGGIIIVAECVMAFCFPTYGITIHLPDFLTFVGDPVKFTIVAYIGKAAFENREKIKHNPNYNDNTGA